MATTGLVIKKSPIGKEDMYFGRRTQAQERAGGVYNISGVVLVYPVNTLDELRNLDPNEYDTAFIVGSGIIDTTPEGEPVILNGNNEFYYFDFTSEETEDVPNVIKSNVSLVGRWKIAKVGENRILQIVDDTLDEKLPALKEEILTEVSNEIPSAVEQGLEVLKRQGGIYDETLTYEQNQFVRAFVKTNLGIESRLYMASEADVSESPIDGTLYSNVNGIKIYNEEGLTESTKYNRLLPTRPNTSIIALQDNKTFKFLGGATIPRGKLKCSVFKNQSVSCYFEIIFSGTSITDFLIRNVMYANVIKQAAITSSYGYIFYPGFSLYCDGVNFGISVAQITQADYIEFDYSEFNQIPTLQTSTSFSSANCYAIREGGGSYIPNIGSTFFSMRNAGLQSGIAEEFYNFMSGSIPWTTGITVDENLYHQYVASCVKPTMDNSGRFTRNIGGNSAGTIGGVQEESLPNATGTLQANARSSSAPTGAFTGTSYSYNMGTSGTSVGGYNLQFSLSNSSSVYQDGANVTPVSITKQERLQLF